MRLPKAVRRRWGLRAGSEVAFLDLGDGLVIVPVSAKGGPGESADPTPDVEQSPPRTGPGMSRPWPPDPKECIAFSVAGESWEVPWGRHDKFGTPSYWIDQTREGYADADAYGTMGLKEATVWGLLHGSGIKAEVGNAFLDAVMQLLVEDPLPTTKRVEQVLQEPIEGFGRYRFWRPRGEYISAAVARLEAKPPPDDPQMFRDYLLKMKGVGPKTAALIESGFKGFDAEVHVNDIWLRRALIPVGIFRSDWNVEHHYDRFEQAFLQFASHGNVPPVALDWCIWSEARE